MAVATTTRLVAVNTILAAAGEAPVTGYAQSDGMDAYLANATLEEVSNQIQAVGWYFNTLKGPITLAKNGSNKIPVADTILRLEFYTYGDLTGYAIRNGYLWDLVEDTDVFDNDITAKSLVELLEWTDLPEAARQAITKKAARIFVDRHVSDPNLARMARQDEAEAMALLQREDIASSNARIFGPQYSWLVDRPTALYRKSGY